MDFTLSPVVTRSSESKYCHTPVYHRVNEQYNDNYTNYNGGNPEASLWCGSQHMVRNQCNSISRYIRNWYNIFRNRQHTALDFRNNNQTSWFSRAMGYKHNLYHKLHYKLLVCLLAIGSPAYAENDNVSNPVAAATGNVTNQAVQFQNNGASSRQNYGPNIACNGSTMTFSPFYMGNDTQPVDPDGYVISENWGFQINFMVPLDREGLRQCRRIAKRQEEKMQLDFELVRALKCAELQQRGFTVRPNTRVYHICSDIVPIQTLLPKENASNSKTNRFGFFKK